MGGEIEVVDSGGESTAHDDFRAGGDVQIIDGGVGAKVDAAAVADHSHLRRIGVDIQSAAGGDESARTRIVADFGDASAGETGERSAGDVGIPCADEVDGVAIEVEGAAVGGVEVGGVELNGSRMHHPQRGGALEGADEAHVLIAGRGERIASAVVVDVSDSHSIAGICAADGGVAQQSELSADVFVGGLEGEVGAVVQAHVGETDGAGDIGGRALAIGGEHAAVQDVDGGGEQIDQRWIASGYFIDITHDVFAVGEIDHAGAGNISGRAVVAGVNLNLRVAAGVGGVDRPIQHRAIDEGSDAIDHVERRRRGQGAADAQRARAHGHGRADGAAQGDGAELGVAVDCGIGADGQRIGGGEIAGIGKGFAGGGGESAAASADAHAGCAKEALVVAVVGKDSAVAERDAGILRAGSAVAKDFKNGRAVDRVDVGDVVDGHANDRAVPNARPGELGSGEAGGVADVNDATGLFGDRAAAVEAGDAHLHNAAVEDVDSAVGGGGVADSQQAAAFHRDVADVGAAAEHCGIHQLEGAAAVDVEVDAVVIRCGAGELHVTLNIGVEAAVDGHAAAGRTQDELAAVDRVEIEIARGRDHAAIGQRAVRQRVGADAFPGSRAGIEADGHVVCDVAGQAEIQVAVCAQIGDGVVAPRAILSHDRAVKGAEVGVAIERSAKSVDGDDAIGLNLKPIGGDEIIADAHGAQSRHVDDR